MVGCPEEVDVVALVRELRRPRRASTAASRASKQPRQEYVLTSCYAEQPTEPVAPYAPDDCAVGDCEFSRVREGYRFELRCEASPAEPTIVDVLEQCLDIDDPKSHEEARAMSRVVRLAMTQSREEPSDPKRPRRWPRRPAARWRIPRKRDFDSRRTPTGSSWSRPSGW